MSKLLRGWIGACVLALGAGACGGDDGDDLTCESFEACGGDPVGTWTLAQVCVAPVPLDLFAACEGETIDMTDILLEWSATYFADGTWSSPPLEGVVRYRFSTACLDGQACEDFDLGSGEPSSTSIPCVTVVGDACECEYVASDPGGEGTWEVEGDGFGTTFLDGERAFDPFCVEGDVMMVDEYLVGALRWVRQPD